MNYMNNKFQKSFEVIAHKFLSKLKYVDLMPFYLQLEQDINTQSIHAKTISYGP